MTYIYYASKDSLHYLYLTCLGKLVDIVDSQNHVYLLSTILTGKCIVSCKLGLAGYPADSLEHA